MSKTKRAVLEADAAPVAAPGPVVVGDGGGEGGRDAVALARLLAELEGARVRTVFHHDGIRSPAHSLLQIAAKEGAGALVVGSPRQGRIGSVIIGSVAKQVLHHAPCEVAVAPHGYAKDQHHGLGEIAVAYDGAEESRKALRRAEELARRARARLTILVAEDPVVTSEEVERSLHRPDLEPDVLREALASVDPDIPCEGRRVEPGWRKVVGTIATAISGAAAGADLLVAGSRRPVDRFLLGSVTNNLIGVSSCPVLVVPRPE